jgi:peptidoglycan/xylan/chitin deacetylase (PgdA/CDA1 family)
MGRKATLARVLSKTGLLPIIGSVGRWSGVLCLNYHRIGNGDASPFDRELWSASAESFDEQVRYLTSHFRVVTPGELPDVSLTPRGRYVLITFDDGYRDNYELALPILQRYGAAATFFVTTGFIDRPRLTWWDEIAWMVRSSGRTGIEGGGVLGGPVAFDDPHRERAVETLVGRYKSLRPDATLPYLEFLAEATGSGRGSQALANDTWMNWDMIRGLRAAGMAVGGHTVNHPVLSTLPPDSQWQEIAGCARRLEAELGAPMQYFSYPVGQRGSFDGHTRACLERLGVRMAFSYYGGHRRFQDWDRLDVRRIAIERYMDAAWVRATLAIPGLFGAEKDVD